MPRELVLPETSLWFNTEVVAQRYPNKPAYLFFGQPLTFKQLHEQASALAGWLQAHGVARGDRVIVFMQNCPQFSVAVQGILRADAVVVPVNPMNRTEELRHYIEDSDARLAIVGQDVLPEIEPLGLERVLPIVYSDYLTTKSDLPLPDFVRAPGSGAWNEMLSANLAPGAHLARSDDLAVMPYTSG
ncbi:MAG TPA: AMP-binding protein, partial [Burkholderiaceae bacterium]|nr:AMP-binding protein [Burkholderiaceae bacterium]